LQRGVTQYGVIKRISRPKTLLILTHPSPVISHTTIGALRAWSTQRYSPEPKHFQIKPRLILRAVPFFVTVPDVRGFSQASAQAQIAARGLTSTVIGSASTSYALNTVGIESPAQGSSVSRGTLISLTLSLGPTGSMPDFTGFLLNDVIAAIGQMGAILGEVIYEDSIYPFPEVPRGTVIGQYPLPGADFNSATRITLFCSSGRVYFPGIRESIANDPTPVVGSTVFP
jgi:hypothetical protein